jgi:hypothetical protein
MSKLVQGIVRGNKVKNLVISFSFVESFGYSWSKGVIYYVLNIFVQIGSFSFQTRFS